MRYSDCFIHAVQLEIWETWVRFMWSRISQQNTRFNQAGKSTSKEQHFRFVQKTWAKRKRQRKALKKQSNWTKIVGQVLFLYFVEAGWPHGYCASFRIEPSWSSPGREHCVVFLGKTLPIHVYNWVPANSKAREWRHDSDKTQTNKLEWWMVLKISIRAKAGIPKTLVKLYFPQNTLMLTESRGEISDLHSIFRLRALRY